MDNLAYGRGLSQRAEQEKEKIEIKSPGKPQGQEGKDKTGRKGGGGKQALKKKRKEVRKDRGERRVTDWWG